MLVRTPLGYHDAVHILKKQLPPTWEAIHPSRRVMTGPTEILSGETGPKRAHAESSFSDARPGSGAIVATYRSHYIAKRGRELPLQVVESLT